MAPLRFVILGLILILLTSSLPQSNGNWNAYAFIDEDRSRSALTGKTHARHSQGLVSPETEGTFFMYLPSIAQENNRNPLPPTPTPPPHASGNLLVNPWFQDPNNPQGAGLYGWTPASSSGAWTCSIKAHNPGNPDGSFTAARWASGNGHDNWPTCPPGPGILGADAYLWQVVGANPSLTTLEFSTWWIVQWIDVAEANIYGSHDGHNWEWIWRPFVTTESQGGSSAWEITPLETLQLGAGYPYYKVEFHCRYPDPSAGCKLTGVHFKVR